MTRDVVCFVVRYAARNDYSGNAICTSLLLPLIACLSILWPIVNGKPKATAVLVKRANLCQKTVDRNLWLHTAYICMRRYVTEDVNAASENVNHNPH